MKIIQPEVGIQPEVVMPNWVEAALTNQGEVRNPDNEYIIPETSYLLSRERSDALIGSLTGWSGSHIPGQWSAFDAHRISQDQTPLPIKEWPEDGKYGLYRASSTCKYCPEPFQDVERGMDAWRKRWIKHYQVKQELGDSAADKYRQTLFPKRCRPCRALYSSRRRGRKAAEHIEMLRAKYDWKFTHWIHTEPVRTKSSPWTKEEIIQDKRRMMKRLSRLYESIQWYSKFTGIQVYEAKVRAPGDVITGTRPDGTEYRREVKTFELHGHIHACIIHPKDGFVDVKEIRKTYFEGSIYKDKYELNKDSNDERSIGKIIGDYLVGYCRKDIIGNMGWCGPRKYRFDKKKIANDETHYVNERY